MKDDTKLLIKVSLDEIISAKDLIKSTKDIKVMKILRKWVDVHREQLKELGYDKKIPKRIKL